MNVSFPRQLLSRRSVLLLLVPIFLLAFTVSPGQSADFSSLLAKVPPQANTVVMFDVENLLRTPIAQKQGWGKQLELAYVERPIFLPPEASKMVMAALLDASNSFRRNWELAVMDLAEPMSMRSIARSEGGLCRRGTRNQGGLDSQRRVLRFA